VFSVGGSSQGKPNEATKPDSFWKFIPPNEHSNAIP